MGRTLEFAMATTVIYVVQLTFAFFVATTVGNKITELFTNVLEVLPG